MMGPDDSEASGRAFGRVREMSALTVTFAVLMLLLLGSLLSSLHQADESEHQMNSLASTRPTITAKAGLDSTVTIGAKKCPCRQFDRTQESAKLHDIRLDVL